MEITKEQEASGILDKIIPPRLEDAGLEDCALPPDSIKEAFFKAASAVKSRVTSVLSDDDEPADCVPQPRPEPKEAVDSSLGVEEPPADKLVGVDSGPKEPGHCVAEKGGGLVEEGRDKVVVVGGDVEVVGKGIEEGVKEMGIGEEDKNGDCADEKDEGSEGEKKPILTEGFV